MQILSVEHWSKLGKAAKDAIFALKGVPKKKSNEVTTLEDYRLIVMPGHVIKSIEECLKDKLNRYIL